MFLVGLAFGPLHHYYYSGLNIVLPKGDLPSVFIKILADQILMSPICIALFFYGMAALEERTLDDANKELKEKFFPTYKVCFSINLIHFFTLHLTNMFSRSFGS